MKDSHKRHGGAIKNQKKKKKKKKKKEPVFAGLKIRLVVEF
jgi:hypothetical protein